MYQPAGFYNAHARTHNSGRCPECGGAVYCERSGDYTYWRSCDWPAVEWHKDARRLRPCSLCYREYRWPLYYRITVLHPQGRALKEIKQGRGVYKRDDARTLCDAWEIIQSWRKSGHDVRLQTPVTDIILRATSSCSLCRS